MTNEENKSLSLGEFSPVEDIRKELEQAAPTTKKRVFEKFVLAALCSIP